MKVFFCKELWKEMPKRIFLSKNKMIFFIKKSLYLKYLKMSCNLFNGVFITHNSQSKKFLLRHCSFSKKCMQASRVTSLFVSYPQ